MKCNRIFGKLGCLMVWVGMLGTVGVQAQAPDTVEAWRQYQAGKEWVSQGKGEAALKLLQEALRAYQGYPEARFKVSIAHADALSLLRRDQEQKDSLEKLLAITPAPPHPWRRGMALRRLGSVAYYQRDFTKSLELAREAEALIPVGIPSLEAERGELYTLFGNVYFRQGNYPQAGVAFDSAYRCFVSLAPSSDLAGTCNNLGIYHSVMNEYDQALAWYEKAQQVYDEAGVDSLGWANLYQNIGIIHSERQDHHLALSYTRKAARIRLAFAGACSPRYHRSLTNLSLTARNMGLMEEAEYYGRRALALADSCPRLSPESRAEALASLAGVYRTQGKLQQALVTYREAEAAFSRLEGFATRKAVLAIQMGKVHKDIGQFEAAIDEYRKVPQLLPGDRSGHHDQLGSAELNWGFALRLQGKYEEALQHVQRSLAWLQPGFSAEDLWWEQAPPLQEQRNTLGALQTRLQILLDWQAAEPEREELLTVAWQTYRATEALQDSLQRYVVQEQSLLEQREEALETYQLAMEVAYRSYQATGDPRWAERAFSISEQGKSSLLLLSLRSRRLGQRMGQGQGFLAREDALRRRVAFFQQLIRERGPRVSAETLAQWQEDQLAADQSLAAWKDSLARFYPDYYRLVYQRREVAPVEVQTYLRDQQTAMVEFFVGREWLYAFWFTADTFLMHRLPLKSEALAQAVQQLRQEVEARSQAPLAGQAHALYQGLLAPGLDALDEPPQRLLIVPDGWLAYLPFSLLLTEATAIETPCAEWPYLMQRMAIGYTHSAQWHLLTVREERPPGQGYRAFGPTFAGEGSPLALRDAIASENLWEHLAQLPGGAREISVLDQTFSGKSYVGPHVDEGTFKAEATSANLLHLVTHGFIDDRAPMGSFLAFSPPGKAGQEDGRLFAWELYDLDLRANLVVLSACNTAVGQLREGEGLMSLARGFHFAGVPSLLATFWAVQDQSTARLIEHFYPALAQGLGKDEALAQAQRTYLQTCEPLFAHPYFWAGLASIGDQQPLPDEPNGFGLWGWILALGFIFVSGKVWKWWRARA